MGPTVLVGETATAACLAAAADLTRCAGAFSWPAPGSAVLGFSVELGDPQQQEVGRPLLRWFYREPARRSGRVCAVWSAVPNCTRPTALRERG